MNGERNEFEKCLREQLRRHPTMELRDVAKLCFQAARGPGHLLNDPNMAWELFEREWQNTPKREQPLYEPLSETFCRINLSGWKQAGLSGRWLYRMFVGSAEESGGEKLQAYLDWAEPLLKEAGFDVETWKRFRGAYEADGMPALSHSPQYRERERPSYRVVNRSYLTLLPILERLRGLPVGVIAIDGRAGAGKSTVGKLLAQVLEGGLVCMDDFFLPVDLRTSERLEQPGGNVHYERFAHQVLPLLRYREPFDYDRFDCGTMTYSEPRTVDAGAYHIVEGAYAHHPYFGNYMDLRVFLTVESEEQLRRIRARNGADMAERFRSRWIPMEERYFSVYAIREQADILLGTES